MRIRCKSIGGFTGPAGAEELVLEVDDLPSPELSRVHELVDAAQFFSLPAAIKKASPQPWDFVLSLTIEDAKATHSVRFHRDAAPPGLQELWDYLSELIDPESPDP